MNLIKSNIENGTLTISVSGKMDSSNAAAIEAEIMAALDAENHTAVILDAEELQYISSAGLRVVLKIRKREPEFKVIGASLEVYEIFDMTGFAEMMTIEKAYRRLSVDGCEMIGQGANGKVYRLNSDTIIKVYINPDSLPDIQRERELARRAFVLGIPTAIPYDVVKVGESYGSVFEMLNAKSLAKLIKEEPEKLDEYVGLYVDLMKKIHNTTVKPEDMPDMRDVVIDWVKYLRDSLPADKWEKLLALVEAVPVQHNMLHGDYHVKNVMIQNDEVLLIDMDTLCQGHPVFELASVFNAYRGFTELDHSVAESFLGLPYETAASIWQKTLPLYLGTEDSEKIRTVEEKAMLIGYVRLLRRTLRRNGMDSEEGRRAIETYREHILELIDSVDTLCF